MACWYWPELNVGYTISAVAHGVVWIQLDGLIEVFDGPLVLAEKIVTTTSRSVTYGIVRFEFYGFIVFLNRLLVLAKLTIGITLGNPLIVVVEVRVFLMVRVKVGRVFLTWRHLVYTQWVDFPGIYITPSEQTNSRDNREDRSTIW